MQQSDLRFTPAQLRALLWVPSDGAWKRAPRELASAVSSLYRFHPALVTAGWGCLTPSRRLEYRLTPAGIAEQARHRAQVG